MKIILTLYSQKFPKKMLPKSEDFYQHFEKNRLIFCRGLVSDYNSKNKLFRQALFFENNRWIWKKNIKPDVIYDRSLFYRNKKDFASRKQIAKDFPFFNDLALSELLSNKWFTYQKFKDFSPKTVLIKNKQDLKKIAQLNSEKIIFKPIAGWGGKGIKIFTKERPGLIPFPFIAQELITTRGIGNIVKGPHDLRVMMLNNKPFHCFIRIPKRGSLVANLGQGGKIKLINRLPEQIKPLIKIVSKKLKNYKNKFYSIDFIFDDNQRPWIIEMNSRPGVILEKEELKRKKEYYKELVDFLKKIKS